MKCTCKRNIEARSCSHCCSEKTLNITYSECVCNLSYPACKDHAPYYSHLWLARLYHISLHYLINGTILEKITLMKTKRVF